MKGKAGKRATKTYLVEVAPLSASPLQATLTYFSAAKLVPGTLVKIPVKSKFLTAVVLNAKDARQAKAEIRKAGFMLRKIRQSDVMEARIEQSSMRALEDTARHYAAPIGTLLKAMLPKLILSAPELFLKPQNAITKKAASESPKEVFLLQMEEEERFGQYRALVRQSFARNSSVLFVVPTHLDARRIKEELSKGIEEFTYVFSLEQKGSEVKSNWLKALAEPHPILFITTPSGLFFPRADIDTIVIERENSRAYRLLVRPYIDTRFLIHALAKRGEKQLVLGDSILPIETLWREKKGEYGETSLLRWRLPAAPARLVDASSKQNEAGRFEIFSPELKEFLQQALTASGEHSAPGRVFLFGARKGLAPTTVCADCGTLLPCLNCGAPVVLHKRGKENIYVCHACSATRESVTVCGQCQSWKLVPLGIGTEEIARQARALFPKRHVEILDKDHAPTDAKARSIAQKFKAQGGILVGTEMAFFHLDPVPYSAVVSVDALFSVPDFRINERIFYLVNRLRELTKNEVLVQTRNIGKQILAWASHGNIVDFYQNEINEREALLYPPFSLFIKITGPKYTATRDTQRLKEEFFSWKPDIFRDSVVMRILRERWPDPELAMKLSLLGPEFSIKVDPESIL